MYYFIVYALNSRSVVFASQSYFCFDKSNQNHSFVTRHPNPKTVPVFYSSTLSFVSFNLSVKLKPHRLSATLPRVAPYEDYLLSATERIYMRNCSFGRGEMFVYF